MEYVVAAGGLGFDGKGYLWEKLQIRRGKIVPKLFTVFTKTLTRQPEPGNLNWLRPWECVRPIRGHGTVNKVDLTNLGLEWWLTEIAPTLDPEIPIVISIAGTGRGLETMVSMINKIPDTFPLSKREERLEKKGRKIRRRKMPIVGVEVNVSCPSRNPKRETPGAIIEKVQMVAKGCKYPTLVKVSVAQEYVTIARGLEFFVQAISLNAVPWEKLYPGERSPLWKLEERMGGGGGGVSGKPAQLHNWNAVRELAKKTFIPIIAPSIMEYEDIATVRELGARAVSFGAIHLPDYPMWLKPWTLFTNPCKPTRFVKRDMAEKAAHRESSAA
jgi:dihydroorotate dehydrogenase